MSIQAVIKHPNSKPIAVFSALAVFGILYNAWVAEQERLYRDEGRTSLYVAGGCAVTLLGASILNRNGAFVSFLCFVSSGLPMILGSLSRFFKLYERAKGLYLK